MSLAFVPWTEDLPNFTGISMETRDRSTNGASLLLLEDDWDHRNVFRDFLTHRGWTVLEATQAASARDLVATEPVDVIVVDLGGTNGWGLLEDLGSRSARPRLICLTGDARTESRDRAVALGADQYLVKPIPLKQLAEAVERLLAVRAVAPPEQPEQPQARAGDTTDAPSRHRRRRSHLRVSRPPRARMQPTQGAPRDAPRPVVLLLEDDDDARVIYRDMLDFAGYDVFAASDGLEGLRYAETHTPDIVITDLHMPGMNGVEVARTLRAENCSAAAIIAVTADSLGVNAARQAHGERPLFDEVLVKPVSPGELVRAVRAYIPGAEGRDG
jgi:DNA-binding response OmpR family regulator